MRRVSVYELELFVTTIVGEYAAKSMLYGLTIVQFLQTFECDLKLKWVGESGRVIQDHLYVRSSSAMLCVGYVSTGTEMRKMKAQTERLSNII